jgi:spore photoproduct lyase
MRFPIHTVLIDDDAADEPLVGTILEKVGPAKALRGAAAEAEMRRIVLSPDPFREGKRTLRLTRHKGAFVKPCPGTREYLCCGLMIVHGMQGCPMDCRYCALQTYFNRPTLEVFVNTAELFVELDAFLKTETGRFHRFCTGEFADSLALDELTGLSAQLIEYFAGAPHASLELKTKTDSVDHLTGLNPMNRSVIGFSVNAEEITARHELRSASLARRLAAATKAQRAGYLLSFHFDPIIPLPEWEAGYHQVVDAILDVVDPTRIVWVSMGVLRFVPDLKACADARSGPVDFLHDGFDRGLDGKSRIGVERRIAAYRSIAERVWRGAPYVRLYLCMESRYVWERALGLNMNGDADVAEYLDRSVQGRA